jgi:hypothetical protein
MSRPAIQQIPDGHRLFVAIDIILDRLILEQIPHWTIGIIEQTFPDLDRRQCADDAFGDGTQIVWDTGSVRRAVCLGKRSFRTARPASRAAYPTSRTARSSATSWSDRG